MYRRQVLSSYIVIIISLNKRDDDDYFYEQSQNKIKIYKAVSYKSFENVKICFINIHSTINQFTFNIFCIC